jgi:hypothetical protein
MLAQLLQDMQVRNTTTILLCWVIFRIRQRQQPRVEMLAVPMIVMKRK